jgi:hypothetical protein
VLLDDSVLSDRPERSVRVSTLELFFDLVFVFTITQLTGVLVDGQDAAALVQVVVMLRIARNNVRVVAAAAVLATIPIGTELAAAAQIGTIAALVAASLLAEELPLSPRRGARTSS